MLAKFLHPFPGPQGDDWLIGILKNSASVSGRISDERFMELATGYEREQAGLKARISELQAEQEKAQEASVSVGSFYEHRPQIHQLRGIDAYAPA